MALEITELQKAQKTLSVKRQATIAIVSLIIGTMVFTVAYLGMHGDKGLGIFNKPLLSFVLDHRNPIVTDIAKLVTTIASPLVFAAIVLSVATIWALKKRELWRPILLVVSVGIASITSMFLKTVTMDARPPQINMIPTFETDFSFPSGHTIAMIVFMLVFGYLIYSRNFTKLRFCGWMIAAVIGTGIIASTRLYLGYHWLTDVVASVGLGFVILSVIILIDTVFVQHGKT